MRKPRPPRVLPPATCSDAVLVELAPRSVGMFRFLLEGYDHLAGFTVLNRHTALLKVFFSPHQREEVLHMLESVCLLLGAHLRPWPARRVEVHSSQTRQCPVLEPFVLLPEDSHDRIHSAGADGA